MACFAFDLKHVESWRRIMTDLFDASDPDWQRAFKYFVANFQDFCIMEDFINPAKDVDLDDCWIRAKRPKAMAALQRAFPSQEWDVLTTTTDT